MTILTDHAIVRCGQRGISEQEIKEICDNIKGTYLKPHRFIRKTKDGDSCFVVFFDNLVQGARIIITYYLAKWALR
jgi:hypothetical protein